MAGYRFCRTDDVPFLVEAFNACWRPHFPDEPSLTLEGFKRDGRELNLWASSCMLAISGEEPVGVLLGAKRSDANLVRAIAVRPGHERRGHGRHLLDSLRRKVAILGPPRLVAEIPAGWAGPRRFLERCGFCAEAGYTDFRADRIQIAPSGADALISAVPFEDLLEGGVLDGGAGRAWERAPQTLHNRSRQFEGFAIASDVRIEAYVLGRPLERGSEIAALGGPRPELLHRLVARLYERRGGPLTIPKVGENEVSFATLRGLGFRAEREYVVYAADLSES
jgi:GNAT superfamily N-acetyltransferase